MVAGFGLTPLSPLLTTEPKDNAMPTRNLGEH